MARQEPEFVSLGRVDLDTDPRADKPHAPSVKCQEMRLRNALPVEPLAREHPIVGVRLRLVEKLQLARLKCKKGEPHLLAADHIDGHPPIVSDRHTQTVCIGSSSRTSGSKGRDAAERR